MKNTPSLNYSRPHFMCLVLILAISIATLIVVLNTSKPVQGSEQAARVVQSSGTGSIYVVDGGLGGGKCVHIVYGNDGYPIGSSSYIGVWNGSYDCVRAITTRPSGTDNVQILQTGSSRDISTPTAESYLGSTIGRALLQSKLAAGGYLNPSMIDGTYSQATFDAIRKLQTANKIPATGYLDARTLELLAKVTARTTTPTGSSKAILEFSPTAATTVPAPKPAR